MDEERLIEMNWDSFGDHLKDMMRIYHLFPGYISPRTVNLGNNHVILFNIPGCLKTQYGIKKKLRGKVIGKKQNVFWKEEIKLKR